MLLNSPRKELYPLVEVKGNSKREVFVTIKDTDQGIHPEIESRLFSKFASKSFQGLGLFISKSIVEAHGETSGWHDAGCPNHVIRSPPGSFCWSLLEVLVQLYIAIYRNFGST